MYACKGNAFLVIIEVLSVLFVHSTTHTVLEFNLNKMKKVNYGFS